MVLLNGAVHIKPYQTSPNITKLQNQQVHVKMGWTPTQIWFINQRDNRIVILWRDGMMGLYIWLMYNYSGIWPEATRPDLPSFDLALALLFTVLNCLVHKDSWQELVRKGEKEWEKNKDDACGRILLYITIIKSRWYKSWFSVLLPFIILDMATVPASDIRGVQKARNSKATKEQQTNRLGITS